MLFRYIKVVFFLLIINHTFSLAQELKISFKKQTLLTDFVSEGATVGDVNKDGKVDIIAGPYWFEAPDWKKHEIYTVGKFSVTKGYSNSMLNFSMDVNLDGWIDLIRIDFPGKAGYWHENPKGKKGHWPVHTIYERVGNESPQFVDIDGDGRKDLLCGDPLNNQMIWLKSPSDPKNLEWKKYTISTENSDGTKKFAHGLGYGDLNGDGRKDVFIKQGWWEGPADVFSADWKFHPTDFGNDCAQMYAVDIDDDGDNDIVSSSTHHSGIWWHEGIQGKYSTTWKTHLVSQTIAETHALIPVDIDSDGTVDFITGNRYYAHNSDDPTDHGPPVIAWFKFQPDKKPYPKWTEYPIDDDSGVGLNITAEDITNDGLIDIVIANKKGVFFFEQDRK
ncbi:MAG: VCBS repeat-containing protein [Cyclobacteriaceae bacterium]|nr:VCBS repeat-containing protein [Cyclobacteriaceae bacterium]